MPTSIILLGCLRISNWDLPIHNLVSNFSWFELDWNLWHPELHRKFYTVCIHWNYWASLSHQRHSLDCWAVLWVSKYHIVETFEGEKFTYFTVFEPPVKVFSMKFGYAAPTYNRFKHSAKVFPAKWPLLTDPWKFSPLKISCYTVTPVIPLSQC